MESDVSSFKIITIQFRSSLASSYFRHQLINYEINFWTACSQFSFILGSLRWFLAVCHFVCQGYYTALSTLVALVPACSRLKWLPLRLWWSANWTRETLDPHLAMLWTADLRHLGTLSWAYVDFAASIPVIIGKEREYQRLQSSVIAICQDVRQGQALRSQNLAHLIFLFSRASQASDLGRILRVRTNYLQWAQHIRSSSLDGQNVSRRTRVHIPNSLNHYWSVKCSGHSEFASGSSCPTLECGRSSKLQSLAVYSRRCSP